MCRAFLGNKGSESPNRSFRIPKGVRRESCPVQSTLQARTAPAMKLKYRKPFGITVFPVTKNPSISQCDCIVTPFGHNCLQWVEVSIESKLPVHFYYIITHYDYATAEAISPLAQGARSLVGSPAIEPTVALGLSGIQVGYLGIFHSWVRCY
jgi:hypothetical protein